MRAASRPRRPRRALLERLELTIADPHSSSARMSAMPLRRPSRGGTARRAAQILAKIVARARGRRRHGDDGTIVFGASGDEREQSTDGTERELCVAVNVTTTLVVSMAAMRRTAVGSRETRDAFTRSRGGFGGFAFGVPRLDFGQRVKSIVIRL